MVGDFVRYKDAVTATLLACEIAALTKANNCSFYQELIALYKTHGFYKERLISITKKGKKGAEEIQQLMEQARQHPQTSINNSKVVQIDDYQSSISKNILDNTTSSISIPKANVLIFTTEDGSKIALRPSGTEPKIKYYISVNELLENSKYFDAVHEKLENKIDAIINSMELL